MFYLIYIFQKREIINAVTGISLPNVFYVMFFWIDLMDTTAAVRSRERLEPGTEEPSRGKSLPTSNRTHTVHNNIIYIYTWDIQDCIHF